MYKVFIVLQKKLPKPNLWSILNPTSIEWYHMQCDDCLSSAVTRALAVIAFCTITIKSLYFYLFAIQYVVSWYLSCNSMYSLQLYYMLIPTFHQHKSAAVKSSVDGGLESWQVGTGEMRQWCRWEHGEKEKDERVTDQSHCYYNHSRNTPVASGQLSYYIELVCNYTCEIYNCTSSIISCGEL